MSRRMKRKSSLQLQLLLVLSLLMQLLCIRHVSAVVRPLERDAHTIYYHNRPPNAKGDYRYEFQTSNGITIKAHGNENGSSGVVQFVTVEGFPVTWTYVADSNGYQPMGLHLSTVPNKLFI